MSSKSWPRGLNGDRSGNGDYIYGKRRLREIDRRICFLTRLRDRRSGRPAAPATTTRSSSASASPSPMPTARKTPTPLSASTKSMSRADVSADLLLASRDQGAPVICAFSLRSGSANSDIDARAYQSIV